MMPKVNDKSSSCTVTYVGGTAFVSCVDSTSSGYQVILLQDNDPYNLIVVNVRPGEKQTVPVVPSGRYCIMELPMGDDIHSEVRYTREFVTEFTQRSTSEVIYIICKYCVYPSSIIMYFVIIIVGVVVFSTSMIFLVIVLTLKVALKLVYSYALFTRQSVITL